MESNFEKTLMTFDTANLLTTSSHASALPPSKPVTINYEWEIHYYFLPAKLAVTFAYATQMHTGKK